VIVLPASLNFDWLTGRDPRVREAIAVRWAVFVEEQGLPADEEVDEWDGICDHLVATLDGAVVGTARLVPQDAHTVRIGRVAVVGTARLVPQDAHTVRIGRVAVRREARHQGVATRLMLRCEARAADQGREVVRLSAQWGVVSFYEQLGYVVTGDPYVEAGLVHVAMTKRIDPQQGSIV